MKLYFLILLALLACNNDGKNSDKDISVSNSFSSNIVKEFENHFQVLDSVAKANAPDTIFSCCTSSIKFMEVNTKIESHSDGTLLGKLDFSLDDLKKWHNWYDKNK